MKASLVIPFLVLICNLSLIEAFRSTNIIDMIETSFIQFFLNNCTTIKSFLRMNYDQAANEILPRLSKVYLVLYYRDEKVKFPIKNAGLALMEHPGFDRTKPITIITHGHGNNPYSDQFNPIIQTIKATNVTNVLALDHGGLMTDNYFIATTSVRYTGEALGETLAELYMNRNGPFHLIGHSLGAHVSGFAAKVYRGITNTLINRITALDPAGPCFFKESPKYRLDKDDAIYVDVIHTDIDGLGLSEAIGHVDFYPNSGNNMPGCIIGECGHVLSIEYYKSSIENSDAFKAINCDSWKDFQIGKCAFNSKCTMGYWSYICVPNGKYFMTTTQKYPYHLGDRGLYPMDV